jgi:hypothetical protein
MTAALFCKDGVKFSRIAPAGFRILGALERTARRLSVDLIITCACEAHAQHDPHSLGEAYDVRTRTLTDDQKRAVLCEVLLDLQNDANPQDAPIATSGGLATLHFFGWIEHPGEPTEHLHFQRRKGTTYP